MPSKLFQCITYLLIVPPKVTWTKAIRVLLSHLNTVQNKIIDKSYVFKKEKRLFANTSFKFKYFSNKSIERFSNGVFWQRTKRMKLIVTSLLCTLVTGHIIVD